MAEISGLLYPNKDMAFTEAILLLWCIYWYRAILSLGFILCQFLSLKFMLELVFLYTVKSTIHFYCIASGQ